MTVIMKLVLLTEILQRGILNLLNTAPSGIKKKKIKDTTLIVLRFGV